MVRSTFRSLGKSWGLFGAFGIVCLIILNTNRLFQLMKEEERTKMELWAGAQQEVIKSNDLSLDFGTLAFDVLQKTGGNPMIQVNDKEKIIDFKNIEWQAQEDPDSLALYALLEQFKKENDPLPIVYKDIVNQQIYYSDSALLRKLQYYPLALLLILLLFGGLIYFFFQTNKVAEQNRLWAGMAKETAHQIGTPLSSLMGWLALLKEQDVPPESLAEMQKDITRLSVITDRFSKIGSSPELILTDLNPLVEETVKYLEKRSGKQVQWEVEIPSTAVMVSHNKALMSWTLENLIKNGLDAMKGKGQLRVVLLEEKQSVELSVIDQGAGISAKNLRHIFSPGFTTKARGWGLGLSLAKRIVEDYHKGTIGVKHSHPEKGTHFQIRLPKL